MKHRVFDDASIAQVFDHDALEQCLVDARVPDTVRIDDDDRSTCAYTKTWRLPALHPRRAKEQALALQKVREQAVERASSSLR
jgi:hypothetical protein